MVVTQSSAARLRRCSRSACSLSIPMVKVGLLPLHFPGVRVLPCYQICSHQLIGQQRRWKKMHFKNLNKTPICNKVSLL